MGQVFEADGDQRQNHNPGGVASTPGQGMTKGGQGLVQGERRHGHQVISTTHHMNSPGCHSVKTLISTKNRLNVAILHQQS